MSDVLWPTVADCTVCSACRNFFGKQGSFTSFFSRTGHTGVPTPDGAASIHGGAAGGFRQVRLPHLHTSGRAMLHDCSMLCCKTSCQHVSSTL